MAKPICTEEVSFKPSDKSPASHVVSWYLRERELHGEVAPAKGNAEKKELATSGFLSYLLDEAMTRLVSHFHGPCLNGETTVRFLAPALMDEELQVMGRIVDDTKRLATAQAEVSKADGTPVARAESRILMLKKDS